MSLPPTNPSVLAALLALEAMEPSPAAGRHLTFRDDGVNQASGAIDNPHHVLRVLLEDIAEILTPDMLAHLSPVDLEQFSLQTVLLNDSASGLLVRLITAFVRAYASDTSLIQAIDLLGQLEDSVIE